MSTQQPEALRLRLAAEQHIALCNKFGAEGLHFDPSPQDVLAILDRVRELEKWQDDVRSNSALLVRMDRTVEMEREACAKICADLCEKWRTPDTEVFSFEQAAKVGAAKGASKAAKEIESAIRARTQVQA